MARKPTDTVQLNLRFPESLRREIERRAKRRGVSMNSEIVRRLDWSVSNENLQDATQRLFEGKETGPVLMGMARKMLLDLLKLLQRAQRLDSTLLPLKDVPSKHEGE